MASGKYIIRDLERRGWVRVSQNNHIKMKWKDGTILIISGSPSCQYAHKHAMKQAKRIEQGLDIRGNPKDNKGE